MGQRRGLTLPLTTNGLFYHSWHCRMAPTRMDFSCCRRNIYPHCRSTLTGYWIACRATEDFSYFTLLRPATDSAPATSLFGISCTRQMDASALLNRPADVTRSTVQKAVVVIADSPQFFGMLRERLSVVTSAWFAQRDFIETEILKRFQESLKAEYDRGKQGCGDEDRDQYLGMSLRELVREFRWQTLVLFKCCLLQPKVSPSLIHKKSIPAAMLKFLSRCYFSARGARGYA
jgi:hypothetical protein